MNESFDQLQQAAVVAIFQDRICLVTSKSGRRWTLPKGTVEPGQTEVDAAAREAWEEAGLFGSMRPEPLLRYEAVKLGQRRSVAVYLLHVERVDTEWPEQPLRTRRWFGPDDAMEFLTVTGQREAVWLAVQIESANREVNLIGPCP